MNRRVDKSEALSLAREQAFELIATSPCHRRCDDPQHERDRWWLTEREIGDHRAEHRRNEQDRAERCR